MKLADGRDGGAREDRARGIERDVERQKTGLRKRKVAFRDEEERKSARGPIEKSRRRGMEN